MVRPAKPPFMYSAYWIGIGLSRPSVLVMRACTSAGQTRLPHIVAAGLVGPAKNSRNTVTEIANKVSTARSTRRIANRNIVRAFHGYPGAGWARGRPAPAGRPRVDRSLRRLRGGVRVGQVGQRPQRAQERAADLATAQSEVADVAPRDHRSVVGHDLLIQLAVRHRGLRPVRLLEEVVEL